MSPTQVPRSLWLTASCTFIRQCDTKPRGLLSDRVSSRKLSVLIPLFMSGTEKKFWSDGILQQCHLLPSVLAGHGTRALCWPPCRAPGRAGAPCAALPGEAVAAGHEDPRDAGAWFTGSLILFIFRFYFSEERKAFKGSTSFCVVRLCSEMSPWAFSNFAPRQESKWN